VTPYLRGLNPITALAASLLIAAGAESGAGAGPPRLAAPLFGGDAVVSGTFVTTLGNVTIAVESYTRTSERLEGDIVLRVPGTTRYHYRLNFAKDGSVRTSEFTIKPLGAPKVDEQRRLNMEFDRDATRLVSVAGGETQVAERPPVASANVLFLGGYASSHGLYGSFGMYEHLIGRVGQADSGIARFQAFSPDTGKAATRRFRRVSPDTVDVDFFNMAWTRVTLDASGRILAADATATTEGTLTRRVDFMEIDRLEKEYLALDRAGQGIGEASPNVETRASVEGVSIVLKYGSPRLRGRTGVLRALVASNAVWRTGANEATTIEFDRDLLFAGVRVPGGRYSLWTFATPEGAELIVNRESGQWGTAYKKAQDLLRLPLRSSRLEAPVDPFTIKVDKGESDWDLRIEWDDFRWSIAIAAVTR
jgi:hypothetical protein